MTTRKRLLACALGLATLAVVWQMATAQPAAPAAPAPAAPAAKPSDLTTTLGGTERYLTHVSTDKPIYRPGEHVYVRGVTLHAISNKPLPSEVSSTIEITGPKGDVVASGVSPTENSVLGFEWTIPENQAGGQYTVKVSQPWTGDAPSERKFDIRAYRPPRLRSQIKFLRDGYGPADEVVGTLEVTRAEGGVPAGAKVTIVARVDGVEAFRGESRVDSGGRCVARFALPAEIARGEGSLAMVIEDGGVVETATKTIPILLQTVDLSIYPEGGDLVAGLPNRVYFEAFTPARKPADLAGVVVDADGKEVATFSSEHEGRGRFTFTPQADGKYTLKITEPAGIGSTYPLLAVKREGLVFSSLDDVSGDSVRLQLASATNVSVSITLSKRAQELSRRELKLTAGETTEFSLSAGEADGVLVATVRDAKGTPLAERLVFSRPRRDVRIDIKADRSRYVPGGKATLTLTATDETGKPMSAVVGLAVTDDSVLEMIERREAAPRLPVMVLLETDVKDLADAQIYLDPKNEQAPAAVDLLLGTQGWRRFALYDLPKFVQTNGDIARRMLALRMLTREEVMTRSGAGFGGGIQFGAAWAADDRIPREKERLEAPRGAVAVDFLDAGKFEDDANGALNDGRVRELAEVANGPVAAAGAIPADAAALVGLEVPPPAATPPMSAESEVGDRKQLRDALDLAAEEPAQQFFAKKVAGGRFASSIRSDFPAVRVFAHHVRPERQPGERTDFAETLFWHAGLKTDDKGQATVEFDLNDAVTSFRVFADAFTGGGALGGATTTIESVEPFYVEPKLPLEVTSGDLVLAPVGLVNGTDESLQASIDVSSPFTTGDAAKSQSVSLPADARVRHLVRMAIGESYGVVPIAIAAEAGTYADNVTRTMTVKPLGFPVERGSGGLIEAGGVVYHQVEIPETVVAGSITAKAVVYPTPLASMTEALARLIQEPSGCFEQTSSTVYPLIMAQQYFLDHQGVDPSLVEKSAEILERGYARLTGFESKGGGYEWFGADPGHDALTAYGLLEFTDMARVRNVDPQMLERTRKWFLAQRDGKGGFARKTNTLHTWLPDAEVANTYNTWAMQQACAEGDFTTEVNWVREAAKSTENTYVIALAANVLHAAGDNDGWAQLLDKLAGRQEADGSLCRATVSVVGSSGDALAIETTALAVLAWLDDAKYAPQVEKGMKFLAEACKGGRFGSTQSTVLALRAITAYDRARAKPQAAGALQLVVDGEAIGVPIEFTPETSGAIELPDFVKLLTPGRHQVEVHMTGGSQMPISFAVNYFATKPDSSEDCKLDLSVSLADTKATEGELTEARVQVVNRTQEVVPSPIAIIGIPGGLEVRHDHLKELVKAGKIATYEVLGRDLVLYWRSLAAGESVELPISVLAAIPGNYTGPASRTYLYYTDEDKKWSDGLRVEITPRN